jgi:hypothetical protein
LKPEIALARTNARGGRYEIWTPSGGTVTFSAQDAAHALAGTSPLGARLLLCKFGCGTPNDTRQLAIELGFAVASLVQAPRNTTIAGISIMEAVVAEVLAPTICARCDGRGWVQQGRKWVQCIACEATGRAPWSASRRAKECGVHREVLRTTAWGKVYEDARRLLVTEELEALTVMAKKLRQGRR